MIMVMSGKTMYKTMYFNVICEEMSCVGGKVIHIDKNVGDLDEVCKLLRDNIDRFPAGKWELYPMFLNK